LLLEAALTLFSRQGYRATSVRDIADAAGTSTGSVYHHFRDKEAIFQTLLERFGAETGRPDFPLNRVFDQGAFPHDLVAIGSAAREVIARWRPYIALFYVDVVEFEGAHIQSFYAGMAARYAAFVHSRPDLAIQSKLREGIPAAAAMMLTTRIFVQYFIVEILFGVPDHYGLDSEDAAAVMADILQRGILRQ
jgi:AcrR family transcriptional regulator